MSFRAYIAAPWELQAEAKQLGEFLTHAGVTTAADWLNASTNTYTEVWAERCLRDVRHADLVIAFNPEEFERAGTGGRHVEVGYAIALAKPIIVVGARTNIFHSLRRIELVAIDGDMVTNILRAAARHGLTTERTNR